MKTVYQLIAAVSADLARTGISKAQKNDQQGYKFRGIDDVLNALAPILATHGLVILPRVIARSQTERTNARGGVLFYVVAEVEFDFVSSHDGSKHTVKVFGEAMDSGDKATNKAMSAAYKYAAFQAFCIPTEGDNDADKTTHEVSPFLTWAQANQIEALAEEHGVDLAAILKYAKAKTTAEIPASLFSTIIANLEKKAKKEA
jgi:hypothetical protein